MTTVEIVLGVILCLLAVVLIVCVLLQSGKEKSLSGTIAGAGESFFSKSKGKTKEKMLSRITTLMAVVFVVMVVVLYIVSSVIR
ncbi:MAG: preprotein translocase subunit SecG [Ruminococcaceae bacterium]|nr:preprotein translocase subunit SecG [Oscillospiraceae bacterium]